MPFLSFRHPLSGRVAVNLAIVIGAACPAQASRAQAAADTPFVSDPLTVETLVAAVIAESPRLGAAEAAAEAAAHRLEYAGRLDDPMLSYAAAPNSSDNNVDVSQRFPWPGTLKTRTAVADREAAAAQWTVSADRLVLESAAKAAYAEWYFVERALEIHRATESLLDQIIATAETRYAAGRASRQDVLQAEVERADLENRALGLERQRTATRARINALMNRPPDATLPSAAPIAVAPLDLDPETLYRHALDAHPELMRLEAEVASAEGRATLAEKAFYPDFQLRAGYNTLWDERDKRAVIGISINVPFARGKREAALGSASAEMRRAERMLAGGRAELLAEVARARAEVVEAVETAELHERELVPLATEYLEAALADYQSGTGAFLNVVTAERRLLATELALERARADYLRRLAELDRWAGGVPAAAGTR